MAKVLSQLSSFIRVELISSHNGCLSIQFIVYTVSLGLQKNALILAKPNLWEKEHNFVDQNFTKFNMFNFIDEKG